MPVASSLVAVLLETDYSCSVTLCTSSHHFALFLVFRRRRTTAATASLRFGCYCFPFATAAAVCYVTAGTKQSGKERCLIVCNTLPTSQCCHCSRREDSVREVESNNGASDGARPGRENVKGSCPFDGLTNISTFAWSLKDSEDERKEDPNVRATNDLTPRLHYLLLHYLYQCRWVRSDRFLIPGATGPHRYRPMVAVASALRDSTRLYQETNVYWSNSNIEGRLILELLSCRRDTSTSTAT